MLENEKKQRKMPIFQICLKADNVNYEAVSNKMAIGAIYVVYK